MIKSTNAQNKTQGSLKETSDHLSFDNRGLSFDSFKKCTDSISLLL